MIFGDYQMINIVVYGRSGPFMRKNINCIRLSLLRYDLDYRISKFDKYTEILDCIIKNNSKKIYIIDVSNGKNIDIALKIREYDYDSIIILVSSDMCDDINLFKDRLMILDLICLDNNYEDRLIDDIGMGVSIIDKHSEFVFKYKRVVYRIPINDITYIEKEPLIKRCIIHTVNNNYVMSGTLNYIMEQLDNNFVRTHQSCIVNLDNIKRIELSNNMIIFKNDDKTDMLNIKMKREIKNMIGVSQFFLFYILLCQMNILVC